jgi:hypothetical protein
MGERSRGKKSSCNGAGECGRKSLLSDFLPGLAGYEPAANPGGFRVFKPRFGGNANLPLFVCNVQPAFQSE